MLLGFIPRMGGVLYRRVRGVVVGVEVIVAFETASLSTGISP